MFKFLKLNSSNALRHSALAATAVMALTFSGVSSAQTAALDVLYDQMDSPVDAWYGYMPSSRFDGSNGFNSDRDSEAAADFQVPAGATWQIKRITVPGAFHDFGSGVMPSEVNVLLYKSQGKRPVGTPIGRSIWRVTPTQINDGLFVVDLPWAITLRQGKYWLAVQASSADETAGQWLWAARATKTGSTAVMRGVNGGYGTQCITWQPMSECATSYSAKELLFRLEGTSQATNP